MSAIKSVLRVRVTTANDLRLIELGYPPLKDLVMFKHFFLQKMIAGRQGMQDDSLMFSLPLTRNASTSTGTYIDLLLEKGDILGSGMTNLRYQIDSSVNSRFVIYREVNPSLSKHVVYTKDICKHMPYHMRISFTRLRLSSHRLRIETGRWVRIPREQRLCGCGCVQDEAHVIQNSELRTQNSD